jgi:hypothetical protein
MILYDPDPMQLLNQEPPNYITIKLPSGGLILAKPAGNYEMQIISISSTDPQDFINSRYQPGNMLKMQFALDNIQN